MERGNARMNELAIEALEVQRADTVLEIGFGPGAALQQIADLASEGSVAGVEPSQTMIREATRRMDGAVRGGLAGAASQARGRRAIASISIRAPRGRALTATVDRAGGGSATWRA